MFRTGCLRALGAGPANALSRMRNERELSDAMATIYIDAFFGSILSDPNDADHQLAEVVKRCDVDAVRLISGALQAPLRHTTMRVSAVPSTRGR